MPSRAGLAGTGELVDPFGGQEDLDNRVLRTVSPRSFAEDPLRIVRGLRLVSQLDLSPDDQTLRQMLDEAPNVRLVSAERIGGGLQADGMGELSKLLLGPRVKKALRLARDTGVLVALIPEFARAIGYDTRSKRQAMTLDEHIFSVVEASPVSLPVRLAALVHDLGKPEGGDDHAQAGGSNRGGNALATPLSVKAAPPRGRPRFCAFPSTMSTSYSRAAFFDCTVRSLRST